MFRVSSPGSFKRTDAFLTKMSRNEMFAHLDRYGKVGVDALRASTPVRTGLTASSWYYQIVKKRSSYSIIWRNRNVVAGTPVAILLHYGHGTGTGGYVQGTEFINPAIVPVFEQIAVDVWKVVTSA